MKYILPDLQETYKDYINRILFNRENIKNNEEYMELHHILPRCCGGEDSPQNLIYLYAQEHYEAHRLLALENPNNISLQHAWWQMCHTRNSIQGCNIVVTKEDYEEARKRHAQAQSNRMSGENHPFYGKHLSDITKNKISKAHKNLSHGEMSEESKQKLSELRKGSKNPAYGKQFHKKKVMCLETKEIFPTMKDAAKWVGFKAGLGTPISLQIQGKQEYAGRHPITGEKLHWMFIDESEEALV